MIPTQQQLAALKHILEDSPLIQPWQFGNTRWLTLGDVEVAMARQADAKVVEIAGGPQEFLEQTGGGTMNPVYWAFYGKLPDVWPPVQTGDDPYFEPINAPSNEKDAISQAVAQYGISKGERQILEAIAELRQLIVQGGI